VCVCVLDKRALVCRRARVKSSFEKHAGDGGFGRSDTHTHVLCTIGQNVEPQKTTKKRKQRGCIRAPRHSVLVARGRTISHATHARTHANTEEYEYEHLDMFDDAERRALTLSTLAGLATTVGGLVAVSKKPDARSLALLLGVAIGVMTTLSFVELYVRNVLEHGVVSVTIATACGGAVYACLTPFLPNPDAHVNAAQDKKNGDKESDALVGGLSKPRLLRLGILMSIAMTLHNLPEGFAVACASFTDVGPTMAFAIGMHNIPEGIITAAPVYAATGSRTRAVMLATVSGLSEPVGALIALKFMKPYLTPKRLEHLLAATGGIMVAVCALELWPEAKKCGHNDSMYRGIVVGSALMLLTLYMGA
jgi:zinc transporter, ZIP family